MKLLLLGGSGFVGINLHSKLNLISEYEVFSTYHSSKPKLIKDSNLYKLDISNKNSLKDVIHITKPDVIVYMISTRYYPPPKDISDHRNINCLGLENFIEIIKDSLINSRIIFINSGAASLRNDSKDNLNYQQSKVEASRIFNENKERLNFNGTELRLFTPYGQYDYKFRLIQSIALKMIRNEEIEIKSPNSKRDFIHIDDVVDAIIKSIFSNKVEANFLEIGSGNATSIEFIVNKLAKILEYKIDIKYHYDNDEEISYMRADINNSIKQLDWSPKIELNKGIDQTVNWIIKNKNYYD
ncbi:MAG: hypothetical protein CL762_02190 [Chloroflexi bacterium]|nr:hypothetical protein [Chloroflexota bacterium]|tara:strand:- start:2116 stop:3009 length:894 start_codon:yes stop_codon:yes gene_type:complete